MYSMGRYGKSMNIIKWNLACIAVAKMGEMHTGTRIRIQIVILGPVLFGTFTSPTPSCWESEHASGGAGSGAPVCGTSC